MPEDRVLFRLRERVALRLAPWLYVPYREEREEALKDLAEVAYLSREAVWTSPRTLVKTALEESARKAAQPLLRSHASYLAEGCRCAKGFCAVHDR